MIRWDAITRANCHRECSHVGRGDNGQIDTATDQGQQHRQGQKAQFRHLKENGSECAAGGESSRKATLNPMHSTATVLQFELLPCVRRRNVRVTAWAWRRLLEADWVISFHSNDEGFINDAL